MKALFSRDTIHFLIENRVQNDKTWFEEHREQYHQFVIDPLVSLVEDLTPTLLQIDDKLICSPKIGGSVSRIWRDTRYSKDKSLYRNTMWCMFVRQKNMGLPEFFFVFSPDELLYGCGYYSAGASSMESIRSLILSGDKDFKTARSILEGQDLFRIEGEMYKRSRYPDKPEDLRNWLDRKTICFLRTSNDLNLLYSNELSATVATGYKSLAPVYHFLMKAESRI